MKYSGTNPKTKKAVAYIALPLCLFSSLLLRSPSNEVMSADMPGGISRYSSKSREIRTPSEYVHKKPGVQRAAFAMSEG